jgi:hypothetical protein
MDLDRGGGGLHRKPSAGPRPKTVHGIFTLMNALPYYSGFKKSGRKFGAYAGQVNTSVSYLPMIEDVNGFAPTAVLIGEGSRADRIWTRDQFKHVCEVMLNGNSANEFLHVYLDPNGSPRFVKAKSPDVEKRITWAWDTITGRAKHQVAIGFYPWNPQGQSRWAAMDLDAHDGNAARAKGLAVAALQTLHRHPELYLVLTTSGSEGWHLFVFSEEFHLVEDWVRLLKRVADKIGAEIRTGICEIFPNETRNGSRPHAIRAPGTWNPKKNQVGAIFFESITPLLQKERKKEVSSFLYHSTSKAQAGELNDSKTLSFYHGGHENWFHQFALTQTSTRHAQLRELVFYIFRQVGHQVALLNADAQYRGAGIKPNATLAEHLDEFEELWTWISKQWLAELTDVEQERFLELETETQRDLFRILRNFARYAATKGQTDFPFSLQNVATRLGVSFQHASKLRQRFAKVSIIVQTVPAMTNRSAARFRWIPQVIIAPGSAIDL